MKFIRRLLVIGALLTGSAPVFADSNPSLSFTQSTDGTMFAVFNTGPCLIGFYPARTTVPTVTIAANDVEISSPGATSSYFGSGIPPCDPKADPGYLLPATLGKLSDGHYLVAWKYDPLQRTGAFDVVSGKLVSSNVAVPRSAALSGMWYDPAYSGSGFNFQVFDGGFFATYFGWDANGKRLWLTSDIGAQQIALNTPIVLRMTYPTAGIFNSPQNNLTQWGSLTVIFSSCNTATATLLGLDGSQSVSLVQLTGIAGLSSCQ